MPTQVDATKKTWVKDLTAQLDHKISADDQKLLGDLVERAKLTDFSSIGSGRLVKPKDLGHAAADYFKEVSKRHKDVYVREWKSDESDKDSDKFIVVAYEGDKKFNLHVRFFEHNGKSLKTEDKKELNPYPIKLGTMWDDRD